MSQFELLLGLIAFGVIFASLFVAYWVGCSQGKNQTINELNDRNLDAIKAAQQLAEETSKLAPDDIHKQLLEFVSKDTTR